MSYVTTKLRVWRISKRRPPEWVEFAIRNNLITVGDKCFAPKSINRWGYEGDWIAMDVFGNINVIYDEHFNMFCKNCKR